MMRRRDRVPAVLLVAALGLAPAACAPEEEGQQTSEITSEMAQLARSRLPVEIVNALDSGNRAYREGDYDRALRFYREATRVDSTVAAGWFGVYMTRRARNEPEAARAALERARALSSGQGRDGRLAAPDTSGP